MDRAVASSDWRDRFGEANVLNMLATSSDHSALFLDLRGKPVRNTGTRFKFESAWLLDANCKEVVEASWRQSSDLEFHQHINSCGQDLWRWGSDHFKKFGRNIQRLRGCMESVRSSRRADDVILFRTLDKELSLLLAQEETYWRQRSKQLWLRRVILTLNIFTVLLAKGKETIFCGALKMRQERGLMETFDRFPFVTLFIKFWQKLLLIGLRKLWISLFPHHRAILCRID